jgi:hypothetical protein
MICSERVFPPLTDPELQAELAVCENLADSRTVKGASINMRRFGGIGRVYMANSNVLSKLAIATHSAVTVRASRRSIGEVQRR